MNKKAKNVRNVNTVVIEGIRFKNVKGVAFDGNNKFYLILNDKHKDEALKTGYKIYPITDLYNLYTYHANDLKFIRTWGLKSIIPQFYEKDIEISIRL